MTETASAEREARPSDAHRTIARLWRDAVTADRSGPAYLVEDETGWRWAFAFLAPGPLLGIAAMLRLRGSPEARLIAGGRG